MDTISYAIERFLRKCFSWKISPRSLEDSLEIVEEEVYENRQPVKGRKRRGLFLKAPSEAKAEATLGWGQLKAVCEAVAGLKGRGDHLYNGLSLRVAVNAADDLDKVKVDGAFTKNRKGGLKATDIMVPVALSRTRDDKVNDVSWCVGVVERFTDCVFLSGPPYCRQPYFAERFPSQLCIRCKLYLLTD